MIPLLLFICLVIVNLLARLLLRYTFTPAVCLLYLSIFILTLYPTLILCFCIYRRRLYVPQYEFKAYASKETQTIESTLYGIGHISSLIEIPVYVPPPPPSPPPEPEPEPEPEPIEENEPEPAPEPPITLEPEPEPELPPPPPPPKPPKPEKIMPMEILEPEKYREGKERVRDPEEEEKMQAPPLPPPPPVFY